MTMRPQSILLIGIALVLLGATAVSAQPPPMLDDPAQAPIDGGLGLLAAAGGAYAWRKLKARTR